MRKNFVAVLLTSILALSACTTSSESPEVDINDIQTQAAQTIVAQITMEAMATPAVTSTKTQVPKTATPSVEPSPSITSTAAKCPDSEFIKDVTISDGSTLVAGETVLKTWRVKNNGSCAWPVGVKLVYGEYVDNLSGATANVPDNVAPGDEVEITLEFTVPTTPKNYYSYWRLVDNIGQPFGVFLSIIFNVE